MAIQTRSHPIPHFNASHTNHAIITFPAVAVGPQTPLLSNSKPKPLKNFMYDKHHGPRTLQKAPLRRRMDTYTSFQVNFSPCMNKQTQAHNYYADLVCFFAVPMWVLCTLVANLRLVTVSCRCACSGLTMTNMRVLELPPREYCRRYVNCNLVSLDLIRCRCYY